MSSPEQHFLKWMAGIFLTVLALIGGWNWFMDPYDIYHHHRIGGINHFTPLAGGNKERLSKPRQIARDKPDVLVLGTSRADWAIDPGHPFLKEKGVVVNAALGGCTMIEAWRLTQHAAAIHKPKVILLGLDAEMFCLSRERSPEWDKRLAIRKDGSSNRLGGLSDWGSTLISQDAWNDSRETLKKSRRHAEQSRSELMQRGGAYQNSLIKPERRLLAFNQRLREAQINFATLRTESEKMADNLEAFEAFINWASSEKIEVYLYISPYHEAVLDTMLHNQSWTKFEEWKRDLVTRNKDQFPLWDFSGYHEIARDLGPNVENPTREMKWWVECSHFRKEVGDRMLARIAAGCEAEGTFGLCLTTANQEASFERQRAGSL